MRGGMVVPPLAPAWSNAASATEPCLARQRCLPQLRRPRDRRLLRRLWPEAFRRVGPAPGPPCRAVLRAAHRPRRTPVGFVARAGAAPRRARPRLHVRPQAPVAAAAHPVPARQPGLFRGAAARSEEHTSELQSRENLVCRLLLEKKKHNT